MAIINCGSCGAKVKVPESMTGGQHKCPSCSKELFPKATLPSASPLLASDRRESKSHVATDTAIAHLAKIEKSLEKLAAHFELQQLDKEYKVVIIDNNFLTAQFNPTKIAASLNSLAQGGWSVKSMVEFNPPSFTGDARAILVLLERAQSPVEPDDTMSMMQKEAGWSALEELGLTDDSDDNRAEGFP